MSNNNITSDPNSFVARYGSTILRGGIAAIPSALFRYQAQLGLKPQQVWFISVILSYKWDANMPYPSLKRMAEQTGVSRRQLHNYQSQLVEKGCLDIINRQTAEGGKDTNYYDFTPLFAQLEELLAREQQGVNALAPTHVNRSSHTHGNPRSHTHGKPSSQPHGKPASHLNKKQSIESEKEDSEKFEDSKVRRVKSDTDKKSRSGSSPGSARADRSTISVEGMATIGDVLATRAQPQTQSRSGREETADEDYQRLQDCIEDRAREFNDTAPLKSSTTRAWRLYKRSGLPIHAFIDKIYQSRSLTQEGSARITKQARDAGSRVSRKSKMAYFFAVLEDQLGMRDESSRSPAKSQEQSGRGDEHEDGTYGGLIER